MDNATHLGLDVHKDTIAVAILRPGEAEPDERTIPNKPEALRALIRKGSFKHPVACYEAGPAGYDTYRLLTSLGVPCDVVAPTMIPRRTGAHVKTDRIDARNLARLHRAGELTPIRVPSPSEEAIRDLVRVREDIKDDRRKTQHPGEELPVAPGTSLPRPGQGLDRQVRPVGPLPTLRGARRRRSLSPLPRRASTCEGASSPPSPPRSSPSLSCRRSLSPLPSSGVCAGSRRSPR